MARTLRVLGTTVTLTPALKAAAEKDLGITLEFVPLDGTRAQRRAVMAPDSFDIYDQWFHDIDLIWPAQGLQPIDTLRLQHWDKLDVFPQTGLPSLRSSAPGASPLDRLYVQLDGTLSGTLSERISMLPTVHNADSFALIGTDDVAGRSADLDSWGALLSPAWSGDVAFQGDAAIGALDAILAVACSRQLTFRDIGNLSLTEIDAVTDLLRKLRRQGHVRLFWDDEADLLARLDRGRPLLASMWWAGFVDLRARGIPVQMMTPAEGYRGWYGGMGLSTHLQGRQLDDAYAYLDWWLDGYAGALMTRNGNYMGNLSAVRRHLSATEFAFWYEGLPAAEAITDTRGHVLFAAGERREGGSYQQRMSRVCVWNTVMDEHNYLVRRWDAVKG